MAKTAGQVYNDAVKCTSGTNNVTITGKGAAVITSNSVGGICTGAVSSPYGCTSLATLASPQFGTLLMPDDPAMMQKAQAVFEPNHTISGTVSNNTYSNICAGDGARLTESNLEELCDYYKYGRGVKRIPKKEPFWKRKETIEPPKETGEGCTLNGYTFKTNYITTAPADGAFLNYSVSDSYTTTTPITTMGKFKEGDTVVYNENYRTDQKHDHTPDWDLAPGDIYTIISVYSDVYIVNRKSMQNSDKENIPYTKDNIDTYCSLISPTPTNFMSTIKDYITGIIIGEPEKSLREAGLKDKEGNYTKTAEELYLNFAMKADEKFNEFLNKSATDYLDEQKKKACK